MYDLHRLVQIGLLLTGMIVLTGSNRERSRLLQGWQQVPFWVQWGVAGIMGLGILSAALAPEFRPALLEVLHIIVLLALLLYVAGLVLSYPTQRLKRYLLLLAFAGMGAYLLTFWQGYITGLFYPEVPLWPDATSFNLQIDGEDVLPGSYLGFSNVRHFNDVQSWTLPLLALVWLKLSPAQYAWRFLVALIGICWYMLLFASDGRGTSLSMIMACLIVGLLFHKKSIPWLNVHGWMAAAGLALWLVFFKLFRTAGRTFGTRYHSNQRIEGWKDTLGHIVSEPLLGVGPMHYAWVDFDPITAHAHNLYLQVAAEWGIPVFLMAGGIVLYALVRWLAFARERTEATPAKAGRNITFTAILFTAGGSALVGSTFHTPISQIFMILIVGFMIGLYMKEHGNVPLKTMPFLRDIQEPCNWD